MLFLIYGQFDPVINFLTKNVYMADKLYNWHIKAYLTNKILIKNLKINI